MNVDAPAGLEDSEAYSSVDSSSSSNWTPPLTPAEVREMEMANRRQYAIILCVSFIATILVYFFGGYKILALVPAFGLFIVFADTPDFMPEGSGSGDSPIFLQFIWFLGFLANFIPLLAFIYLIVRH